MQGSSIKKFSIWRMIEDTLEIIWFVFKLAVVVGIVTIIVGFLLSRGMMVRGRNGVRQSTAQMKSSATALQNKETEDEKVAEWLDKVKREKVTLVADDEYILVARKVVVDAESDKWAVILHGYNGSMQDIYDIAMHYTAEGYNVLMPDLRANGESEGALLGMGWLDRLDTINWIDTILEENPSAKIVVHGVDIGAEAGVMLTGESVKSSIKAVVADGAYTSAWDVLEEEYQIRYEGKPVFPFLNMMNPVLKVWAGYSLKEADAVKQVQKAQIPILFVRGSEDTYATKEMADDLNNAVASSHEMYEIKGATHDDCRYVDTEGYYNKTFQFINLYVK